MTFYLAFPLLMHLVHGWRSALVFFLSANLIAKFSFEYLWIQRSSHWPGISDGLVSTFLNLWFPTQLPVFAVGFLFFFLVRDWRGCIPRPWPTVILFCSVLAMIFLALKPDLASKFYLNSYTAYGLCFCVFSFCHADGAAKWLVNAPIRFLGKISFSAYLWHFAILGVMAHSAKSGFDPLNIMGEPKGLGFFLWFFPLIVLLTSLFSTITYQWVEIPLIEIGNNLIEKFNADKTCSDTVPGCNRK